MRKIRKLLIFRNKLKFESDLIFRNGGSIYLPISEFSVRFNVLVSKNWKLKYKADLVGIFDKG